MQLELNMAPWSQLSMDQKCQFICGFNADVDDDWYRYVAYTSDEDEVPATFTLTIGHRGELIAEEVKAGPRVKYTGRIWIFNDDTCVGWERYYVRELDQSVKRTK